MVTCRLDLVYSRYSSWYKNMFSKIVCFASTDIVVVIKYVNYIPSFITRYNYSQPIPLYDEYSFKNIPHKEVLLKNYFPTLNFQVMVVWKIIIFPKVPAYLLLILYLCRDVLCCNRSTSNTTPFIRKPTHAKYRWNFKLNPNTVKLN